MAHMMFTGSPLFDIFDGRDLIGLGARRAQRPSARRVRLQSDELQKKQRKFFKTTRALHRGLQRDLVFVDPKFMYVRRFETNMLLAEEYGGVPYRGPADALKVLEDERKKQEAAAKGSK